MVVVGSKPDSEPASEAEVAEDSEPASEAEVTADSAVSASAVALRDAVRVLTTEVRVVVPGLAVT